MDDKESDYGKLRFTGKKEDWPKWSETFLAIAAVKNFKRVLLGLDKVPNEKLELDEDSQEINIKKQLRVRSANERAYGALILTCTESRSF